MRLADLEPVFMQYYLEDGRVYHKWVMTLDEAQGITFTCPKCSAMGKHSAHSILCWSRTAGVPDLAMPGPGRWAMTGNDFADLTMKGERRYDGMMGSDSVSLVSTCGAHFFVTDGAIVNVG